MRSTLSALLVIAAAAFPVLAGRIHEHGVARLDVAVEASRITLDLHTPLENLLGFERAPRSDAERERAAALLARLRDAGVLFRIDAAGGCTLGSVELTAPALQLGPPAAGDAARDGHADLEGHFEFQCRSGTKAGFIEVGLFEAFAPLRRVELQVVTPKGQLKASLARPASRVALLR